MKIVRSWNPWPSLDAFRGGRRTLLSELSPSVSHHEIVTLVYGPLVGAPMTTISSSKEGSHDTRYLTTVHTCRYVVSINQIGATAGCRRRTGQVTTRGKTAPLASVAPNGKADVQGVFTLVSPFSPKSQ